MYQLEETTYLYILILLPIILLVFLYNKYWQKITIKKYFDDATFNFLSPELSSTKSYIKTSLTLLIISILVFGLVNPKIGTELKTVKREGVDIVFAIDVSKSMLAEDIAPNRIFKAKRLVSEIFNKLGSDRVGIIAYASTAIPVLPITNDFSSAKMFLESLNTDMLSSQGTSIVEAIELSKGYFDDENQTNRVLCILSDGEDHEYDENQFISTLSDSGIIILSVGLGSTKGAPIPIKENNIVKSYKKDDKGEVVITKLNDELLKKIATQSSGKYIKGDNTSLVVDEIINELKEMDKKEFESKQFVSFKDQFQWFLGAGLLLFLVNSIIFDKKTKWIEKLNLFNENN
jgi:Ca-activated chloride channel family protein|tara:strand:- start:7067 stop:8104 length:1038 start_codon:yes stop_codon:yes gene_type:complete